MNWQVIAGGLLLISAVLNLVLVFRNAADRMDIARRREELWKQEKDPEREVNRRIQWYQRHREKETEQDQKIIAGLNAKIAALHTLLEEQSKDGGDGGQNGHPAVDNGEGVDTQGFPALDGDTERTG